MRVAHDQVGFDHNGELLVICVGGYTKRLQWCSTHQEPAWQYGDGGVSCMYDLVVEAHTDDHKLVPIAEAVAS